MALINGITLDGNIVSNTLDGIGGLFRNIRTAITGKLDPEKEAAIELQMRQMEAKASEAQTEINKIEASHPNIFVSGWRPCVGWLCCLGLAYTVFIAPILSWISLNFKLIPPPVINSGELVSLLLSLLGMGIMRTAEKFKGIARN